MNASKIWVLLFLTLLRQQAAAQQTVGNEQTKAQAVLLQGGGDAFLSLLYDRRLAHGLGANLGIGFYGGGGSSSVHIPLSLYYLAGRRLHFAEISAGAVYASNRISIADVDVDKAAMFYQISGGYRYRPTAKSFVLRAGAGPRFFKGGQKLLTYYLGIGFGF